jgi:hypothetical protein
MFRSDEQETPVPTSPKPDRIDEITLMAEAPGRTDGYVRNWLADPEFQAALHRYDGELDEARPPRRIAARPVACQRAHSTANRADA